MRLPQSSFVLFGFSFLSANWVQLVTAAHSEVRSFSSSFFLSAEHASALAQREAQREVAKDSQVPVNSSTAAAADDDAAAAPVAGPWQQAAVELEAYNGKLRAYIAEMETQAKTSEDIQLRMQKSHAAAQDEVRALYAIQAEMAHEQTQWKMEQDFLVSRRQNLTTFLAQLNESAKTEVYEERQQHLQLETDATALRLRVAQMEAQISDSHKRLVVQDQHDGAEVVDLQRQLHDMQLSLGHLQKQLEVEPTQKTFEHVQSQLDEEVKKLAELHTTRAQVYATCKRDKEELEKVFTQEHEKATSRRTLAASLCQKVTGQHQMLEQWVKTCEAQSTAAAAFFQEGQTIQSPLPQRNLFKHRLR